MPPGVYPETLAKVQFNQVSSDTLTWFPVIFLLLKTLLLVFRKCTLNALKWHTIDFRLSKNIERNLFVLCFHALPFTSKTKNHPQKAFPQNENYTNNPYWCTLFWPFQFSSHWFLLLLLHSLFANVHILKILFAIHWSSTRIMYTICDSFSRNYGLI